MGAETSIQWCDHTFNPWIGCSKVSAGCTNCYAEAQDRRWRPDAIRWGVGAPRTRTTAANWRKPITWNRTAELLGVRRRVFCASLADVFDLEVPDTWRGDLFHLIEKTPSLDWLLLTKRPENLDRMAQPFAWPRNVWLGVTAENQAEADRRIPLLLAQEAAVRFLSLEPLLEPVDLTRWLRPQRWALRGDDGRPRAAPTLPPCGLDWAIIGGESGPKARRFDPPWARALVSQCRAAEVAPFVKQLGSAWARECSLDDSSAGDPAEWTADLRVREFPKVRR